jgi:hypothetical protein
MEAAGSKPLRARALLIFVAAMAASGCGEGRSETAASNHGPSAAEEREAKAVVGTAFGPAYAATAAAEANSKPREPAPGDSAPVALDKEPVDF